MKNDKTPAPKTESEVKEPYEPPAVISEEVFETLAVTCGKTAGPLCFNTGGFTS